MIGESCEFTVHMMIGIPGAGKSTWARKFHGNAVVIARDDIRNSLLLDDPTLPPEQIKQRIKEKEEEYISSCCQNKVSFVLDNMNLNSREAIIKRLRDAGARVIAVYMNTPLEVCKERRKGYITANQMDLVSKKLVLPSSTEFDKIIHVRYMADSYRQ